jgi:hypothetical protein
LKCKEKKKKKANRFNEELQYLSFRAPESALCAQENGFTTQFPAVRFKIKLI